MIPTKKKYSITLYLLHYRFTHVFKEKKYIFTYICTMTIQFLFAISVRYHYFYLFVQVQDQPNTVR